MIDTSVISKDRNESTLSFHSLRENSTARLLTRQTQRYYPVYEQKPVEEEEEKRRRRRRRRRGGAWLCCCPCCTPCCCLLSGLFAALLLISVALLIGILVTSNVKKTTTTSMVSLLFLSSNGAIALSLFALFVNSSNDDNKYAHQKSIRKSLPLFCSFVLL